MEVKYFSLYNTTPRADSTAMSALAVFCATSSFSAKCLEVTKRISIFAEDITHKV